MIQNNLRSLREKSVVPKKGLTKKTAYFKMSTLFYYEIQKREKNKNMKFQIQNEEIDLYNKC